MVKQQLPTLAVLLPGIVFICDTINSLLESQLHPPVNVQFKVLHPDQDNFLSLGMENREKFRLDWSQNPEWGSEAALSARLGLVLGVFPVG